MNNLIFATHLGFSSWEDLLKHSHLVSSDNNRTWFVTNTPTWYKWVLWNTNYDLYFNHKTKLEALETLKFLYEEKNITKFDWKDATDFSHLQGHMWGRTDLSLTTEDPLSWTSSPHLF